MEGSHSFGKGTIGALLDYLLPQKEWQELPQWPPDAFALAAAVLHCSGAYRMVIELFETEEDQKVWCREAADDGREWRNACNTALTQFAPMLRVKSPRERRPSITPPDRVQKAWKTIVSTASVRLSETADCEGLAAALLRVVGAADEACVGSGTPSRYATGEDVTTARADGLQNDAFDGFVDDLLMDCVRSNVGSTLSYSIDPAVAQVLPKQHTPQTGLTIRSLTHHVALRLADEIIPMWFTAMRPRLDRQPTHSLNILLVPWPRTVRPAQFSPRLSNSERRFDFEVPSIEPMLATFKELYVKARAAVGSIDGVIFPELSLGDDEIGRIYQQIRETAFDESTFIIAGMGSSPTEGEASGSNYVSYISPIADDNHVQQIKQYKLHRWRMEGSQIGMYGVGSRLDPSEKWWENIGLPPRRLHFFGVTPWLTMCVLICEDLARQDSVSDLLRAVGPNLVVAVLMDGPQLASRWSARYATVLADDPGSSVLTLTSAGMAELARPPRGAKRSRVVALWKDALSGEPTEIELPERAEGLVLSLSRSNATEYTADGRSDHGVSSFLRLTGVHPVWINRRRSADAEGDATQPAAVGKPTAVSMSDASLLARIAQMAEAELPLGELYLSCFTTPRLREIAEHLMSKKKDPSEQVDPGAERIYNWALANER